MSDIYFMNIGEVRAVDKEYFESRFPERLIKSENFRFDADKFRSLAAGYLLSEILGISEKELKYGEYGKPYVNGKPNFSLSHSGDFAVLAVSDKIIGVDIEKINPKHTDIADRVFTEDEISWMRENPENRFWTLWTLKEAASKAVGKGLSLDFGSFTVLPFIENNPIYIDGIKLYGKSFFADNYSLSVVSESDEAPVFSKM